MRKLMTSRIRTVLVIALLLSVVLAVVSALTGLRLPEMAVKGVLTPLRTGTARLTEKVEEVYNYIFKYETLAAENEALKKELAEIENNARIADSVTRENQRLRDLLNLKNANDDYNLVDGYIISWSSNDWNSTFTINRGSNVGIQEGMCAVTANGELVGLVQEVGSNYAVIKSIMDSSLEISATISSSGYNGMVKGGYSEGLSDKLRMNYLPSSATIHLNDQVVTTGSTVYPRGLIVGKVVDAGFADTGVAKYAILEPAAAIDALEQVFVITDFNNG